MGIPFIRNKQTIKRPCEPFHLNLFGGTLYGERCKNDQWPACFCPCHLAGTVQTTATKKNAPLPRHVISHPGRQLKCKLKMLIRTVSTSILMHKMGILHSVRRMMHCSSGKTFLPLLLWSEQK